MSRLHEALTALERKAPSPATADVSPVRPETRRRRRPAVIIGIAMVVAAAVTLTIVPRARSTAYPTASMPPAPDPPPAPTSSVGDTRTIRVADLRARARDEAILGGLDHAEALLRQAIALAPSDAEAWTDLGVVLVRRGQTRAGIEAFQHSIALDPKSVAAHRNLAVALERDGQTATAVTHYRAFLTFAPPEHPDRVRVEQRLATSR
jgi:cytochrome c-type biogenesis protein CcmH/NrfG